MSVRFPKATLFYVLTIFIALCIFSTFANASCSLVGLAMQDLNSTTTSATLFGVFVYNDATGATLPFFSETHSGAVNGKAITISIGSQNCLDLNFGQTYYIDVNVGTSDLDWNGSERKKFVSSVGDINWLIDNRYIKVSDSNNTARLDANVIANPPWITSAMADSNWATEYMLFDANTSARFLRLDGNNWMFADLNVSDYNLLAKCWIMGDGNAVCSIADLNALIGSGGGGTTDHSVLTNLNWSVAGHYFDSDLNLNNYNIINHDIGTGDYNITKNSGNEFVSLYSNRILHTNMGDFPSNGMFFGNGIQPNFEIFDSNLDTIMPGATANFNILTQRDSDAAAGYYLLKCDVAGDCNETASLSDSGLSLGSPGGLWNAVEGGKIIVYGSDGNVMFSVNEIPGTYSVMIGNAGTGRYTLPTSDGNPNDVLQTDGSSNVSWQAVTATPAGNNGAVQYNNSGAFGGEDNFIFNRDTNELYVGYGVTGSQLSAVTENSLYAGIAAGLYQDASGGVGFKIWRSRGTYDVPLPLLNNDQLGGIDWSGNYGAAYPNPTESKASIIVTTTEDWNEFANGSRMDFSIIPHNLTYTSYKLGIDETGLDVNGNVKLNGCIDLNGTQKCDWSEISGSVIDTNAWQSGKGNFLENDTNKLLIDWNANDHNIFNIKMVDAEVLRIKSDIADVEMKTRATADEVIGLYTKSIEAGNLYNIYSGNYFDYYVEFPTDSGAQYRTFMSVVRGNSAANSTGFNFLGEPAELIAHQFSPQIINSGDVNNMSALSVKNWGLEWGSSGDINNLIGLHGYDPYSSKDANRGSGKIYNVVMIDIEPLTDSENEGIAFRTKGAGNVILNDDLNLTTNFYVDGNISKFNSLQSATSTASGQRAVALGYRANASGERSFAAGADTISSGFLSTALNFATKASGQASLAVGWDTNSSGQASFSSGQETSADGLNAFSAGYRTHALAAYSAIFGNASDNNISNSFAVGYNGYPQVLIKSTSPEFNIRGDANITKDLNVSGNSFITVPYGGMYYGFEDSSYTINITDFNKYYTINNLSAGEQSGFTIVDSNSLKADYSGVYHITTAITFTGANNSEYGFKIYVNDQNYDKCYSHDTSDGKQHSTGTACFLRLSAGDKVNYRVEDEINPAQSVAIKLVQVNALRVGN